MGWLILLWMGLWQEFSVANAVAGAAVAITVVVAFPPAVSGPREHVFRPLAALRLVAYFAWKLVEANLVLAREVVTPRDHIRTGIVAVPLHDASPFVTTLVANLITLTPGSLTLDIRHEPTVLYVHVLHLGDVEEVRAGIHRLQHLALRAVGTRTALARLEAELEREAPP